MATLYRTTQSRFWFARFTDPATGKRVSKSTKSESKKSAKVIAGRYESDARDEALRADVPRILQRAVELASLESQAGTLTLQRAEDLIRQMTAAANPTAKEANFRRFAASWLDDLEKDISDQSAANYRFAVKIAQTALGPKAETSMRKITADDVAAIQGAFAATGASGSAVNKNTAVIRRILESAVTSGAIDRNPALGIKSRPTADSIERLPFTLEEVRRLIAAAPCDEWRGLIVMASQTGIRRGDLVVLTAGNVTDSWLRLTPSKTSKTSGAVVNAPLNKPCLEWLAGRPAGPLFPALAKSDKRRLTATFERIMATAGVEKEIVLSPGDPPKVGTRSFHSLRHSFIAWMAEADVPADVRMKLSGHTTERIHADYSHHGESLQRAVSQLPAL